MIKLRPYQEDAIRSIKKHFQSLASQYIEMPTGSGKTITFLSYAVKNHKKILIIVPSTELLNQVYETSLLFYHKSQVSRKGSHHNEDIADVHICIVNSIRGLYLTYLCSFHFDLIIVDEAHHSQAASYRNFFKYYPHKTKTLGVTATPDRKDGKLITEILGQCTFKLTISEMIKSGYLSDIEGFLVKTEIDLSDLSHHNGDFSLPDLYKRLCTKQRNKMIIEVQKEHLSDRKTLIFCINIAHSKIVNTLLNEAGVASAHIDGKMSEKERQRVLKAFRNGEISCLCNCQLLTEGFDEPSIDGILLARPTASKSLFLQMIGRGLRIFQGKKNCKIIDLVDINKNLIGFNSLVDGYKGNKEIERFSSLKDIEDHLAKEIILATEWTITRSDLLNLKPYEDWEATQSMIDYLKERRVLFCEPISFDEGSFLIWLNELKKEYTSGINKNKEK